MGKTNPGVSKLAIRKTSGEATESYNCHEGQTEQVQIKKKMADAARPFPWDFLCALTLESVLFCHA